MREYRAKDLDAPVLLLAHGAGAGEDHPWMRRVASALADRGVSVVTFNFPYVAARRSVPDKPAVLEAAYRTAWAKAAATFPDATRRFAGGKSMGGRIASQVAASHSFDPAPDGLVFFGYPLHPPGKPDQRRDRHLPDIRVPMLFLHGTRDAFGSPDEMRTLADGLPGATLELIAGGDHSLVATKRDDPEGKSVEHAIDRAGAWIKET